MKQELSTFQKIAEIGLAVIAVAVEFIMSYLTLYLNAWSAVQKGYWMGVWIPIVAWVVLTLWVALPVGMLLSRTRTLKSSWQNCGGLLKNEH
jgi:hypothetical protein